MKSPILMRLLIILLILKSLDYTAFAQNNAAKSVKSVFITGFTYDSKTLEPLSNTSFRINNKFGFASNESGRFSFNGNPGDTVVFSYVGYRKTKLFVPDTLKSEEYVMGVFMQQETVKLAEIIILPRMPETSIMITPVKTDQKTMDIAQNHANDAVVKGLTQPIKVYDADMNAKKAIRNNQMRTEYKGMLVSPENSVGVSTQSYRTYSIIYGSPITTQHRLAKEMITDSESAILLEHFEAVNRRMLQPQASVDTTVIN